MNLIPTLISIGLGISISFLYLQKQKDEPNKINYRAALSEFEQSALAFAAKTQLDANNPQPQSFCQNMNFEFGSKLAAGSQWEIDITGLDCDIALLTVTTATAKDLDALVSAATESGRAQDAEIDYSTRKISWTQRIYNRKTSDLGFKAKIKNNTLGSCLTSPCNQTNSLTSSTTQAMRAGWSDYGNWNSCYQGSQQRTRTCINANPEFGLICSGSDTESQSCNRPPTAKDLKTSATEKTSRIITLEGNDPDSDPLQYTISSKGSGKITHAKGANTVSYISHSETETSDQFTYKVCDNSGSCSREATVTIQITLVDDPPSAKSFTLTANEQELTKFKLEGTDPEKQRLEYYIISNPQNGEARNTHENATYKSLSDTATKDQFTYKVCDNSSCSEATITIQIKPINDAPVAYEDTAYAEEEKTIKIKLEGEDPDNDPLVYQILSKGSGKITHAKDANTVSYLSNSETLTYDQFTYRACDSKTCSDPATVTIQITLVNDPPSAKSFTLIADEQELTKFKLEGTDPEKQRLEYYIISKPQNGEARNTHENATYKSLSDTATKDQFTYKACDNSSCSEATITIQIKPINDAPVAYEDTAYTEEGKTTNIYLYGSDVDSDVAKLTYKITRPPLGTYYQKGHILNYTALIDQLIPWGASSREVVDNLDYQVCDDQKLCSKATTVSIKNTQINTPPKFVSITPKEQRATATVGVEYSYEFKIIDSDYAFGSKKDEEVTFTKPDWLKIDENSKILDTRIYKAKLIGTPRREDINSFNNGIVITAKDGWGRDQEQFTIDVKPP